MTFCRPDTKWNVDRPSFPGRPISFNQGRDMNRLILTWMLMLSTCVSVMAQSTISGNWNDASVSETFQNIGKQGGVKFEPWPATLWETHMPQKVSTVMRERNFWDGVLELARTSHLRMLPTTLSGQDRRVRIVDEKSIQLPVWSSPTVVSGPLTLVLEAVRPGELELVAYADPALRDFVKEVEVEGDSLFFPVVEVIACSRVFKEVMTNVCVKRYSKCIGEYLRYCPFRGFPSVIIKNPD